MDIVDKPKAKKGRPKKELIESKRKPGKVGRPAGDTYRIQELKARLLSTTGDKVINKIVSIAMTDGHPVQGAALKMCIDRVLPISYFEKDKNGSSRPAVNITITGIGGEKTIINGSDPVDNYTEFTDVEYTENGEG